MTLLSKPMGDTGPGTAGGRLWPRWLALAAVVIGLVVAFVNLGTWQLSRLDQRRERNEVVVAHESSPVLDYAAVFGRPITDADQWQKVRVVGSFDPALGWVVRYRSNAGVTGYEVVGVLQTSDGRHLLVSRGFAQRPAGQDFPQAAPAPPTGTVTIVGHVRRAEQGDATATTPTQGAIRLINSAAIGSTLPFPVLEGYLGVLEISPVDPAGLVPVQPPELNEGNHLSYAIQWFTFSGMAALGLVLMIRSDLKAKQRAAPAPVRKEAP
ncbi:MAG: SURF1 family protein [Propionicimonas sp.]